MLRAKLLRGGIWLTAGNALSALAGFLRNILVARLISVEDFGIVVLLSMTLSIIETLSNLAIDRLLVQAPDGDDPKLQANAHALQVARGIVGGGILFIVAPLLAALFKIPAAGWAFQVLALVPVIRSFTHLDTVRLQRELLYKPTFWTDASPQVVALIVAVSLAFWLQDYSAIVWTILVQAGVQVTITHVLARRPYRFAWELVIIKRIFIFGWPLLASGLLMFVILQGDKALIAIAFNPETVGWFGAAFMLSMAPALVITSVMQGLFLPLLSSCLEQPEQFFRWNQLVVHICLATGLLVAIVFAIFGPEILVMLFGLRYQEGAVVSILFGLTQGVRIAKMGQFVSAVALARTKVPLAANMGRALAFVVAVEMIVVGYGPAEVAATGLVGEILSYVIGASLVAEQTSSPLSRLLPQVFLWVFLAAISCGSGVLLRELNIAFLHYLAGLLWICCIIIVYVSAVPILRIELLRYFKRGHSSGS